MVAKLSTQASLKKGESGQSILEFLLMLPMMIGLVLILVRVNSAIQVSIVNQQYARAHALSLNYNSPVYPSLVMREKFLVDRKDNQMVIGVSNNTIPENAANYKPEAPIPYVARKKGMEHLNDSDKETNERASVRVRHTVTICTQSNVVKGAQGYVPILPIDLANMKATAAFNLGEDSHQFDYCRSNLQYTVDAQEAGS